MATTAAAPPGAVIGCGDARGRLRRTIVLLALAALSWALAAGLFAMDVTEYGVVTRFGRVVRVVEAPGLHLTAPFDRVLRLDKRLLFSAPARAEYLTADKKNVIVQSLVTWRIADPERFLATVATRTGADERVADVILAEIGSVLGRYPSSALISSDDADGRYPRLVSEIRESVARFARAAYGIEVTDVSVRHVSLPEQNRQSVFERMKAERGKMAKRYRSEGELESKRIIAEADREKARIDAEAYAEAQRLRADGDAEASRVYAAAFGRNPSFYQFLRTLQAYEKVVDESTTLVLPADAEALGMLHDAVKAEEKPARPAGPGPRSGGVASAPRGFEGDNAAAGPNGRERGAAVLNLLLGGPQDHKGPR